MEVTSYLTDRRTVALFGENASTICAIFAPSAASGSRGAFATIRRGGGLRARTLGFGPSPRLPYAAFVLIAFHKPCGVLSRFTPDGSPNRTLAGFGFPRHVYPLGRLDADSEGLLLLSDEPRLNQTLLHPRHAHQREYWAQVERIPTADALARLGKGLALEGSQTLPCRAWLLDPQPSVLPRDPPIRFRKTVPTCWIGLELTEGKNRQVRRMTAAIGHPTLRLIRVRIGGFELCDLAPGHWRILAAAERKLALAARTGPAD
jgi:23S rRNA pseudouridine2457 synthase